MDFEPAKNNLDEIKNRNERFIETLQQKINEVKEIETLLSKNVYDTIFDLIDKSKIAVNNTENNLKTIKISIDSIEELNKNINNLLNELGKEVNNNKFRYGLQGQIIKNKNEYLNRPKETYPEGIDEVLSFPVQPTPTVQPNEQNAGKRKTKRRNKKLRKTRRKYFKGKD